LARTQDFPPPRKKFQVFYTQKKIDEEQVFLLEPQTYMNRSGPAVRSFLSYFGETAPTSESLLVVHDDLDLPMGTLRFRPGGSSGGHRGVASVIEALASDHFSRLKVGVGRPAGQEAAEYVLESLSKEEEKGLLSLASKAASTLPEWIREGTDSCANHFNGVGFASQ
jgi:PTH1 family peptidyl-tRNA hydrolase